ncbi:MAG: 4Fe-4S dicluster domain-containing protein [Myxococcota bacterium]
MSKTFIINPEKCTGCRTCELTCAYTHTVNNQPGISRIRAFNTKPPMERGVPIVCLQCDSAACVEVCPVGALQRNQETGAIDVDYERCINCHACYSACPFGNILIEPVNNRIAKCDKCGGDPQCVKFCPTNALEYK